MRSTHKPPLTSRCEPVRKLALSESGNVVTFAISSGCPKNRRRCWRQRRSASALMPKPVRSHCHGMHLVHEWGGGQSQGAVPKGSYKYAD